VDARRRVERTRAEARGLAWSSGARGRRGRSDVRVWQRRGDGSAIIQQELDSRNTMGVRGAPRTHPDPSRTGP
jgi:hypothetical protein